MPHSLYIAGAEPQSGKSVVILGMMELLSGQGRKVGFFRPVIWTDEGHDKFAAGAGECNRNNGVMG